MRLFIGEFKDYECFVYRWWFYDYECIYVLVLFWVIVLVGLIGVDLNWNEIVGVLVVEICYWFGCWWYVVFFC